MKVGDNDTVTFWMALGFILGVRLAFYITEICCDILSFRLVGRRAAIAEMVAALRNDKYPMREYAEDDPDSYLYRITENPHGEYSDITVERARNLTSILNSLGWMGILREARTHAVMREALQIYTPPSSARYQLGVPRDQTQREKE